MLRCQGNGQITFSVYGENIRMLKLYKTISMYLPRQHQNRATGKQDKATFWRLNDMKCKCSSKNLISKD